MKVVYRGALVAALLELGPLLLDLVFLDLAENALDGGIPAAFPHLLGHGFEFVALDVCQLLQARARGAGNAGRCASSYRFTLRGNLLFRVALVRRLGYFFDFLADALVTD